MWNGRLVTFWGGAAEGTLTFWDAAIYIYIYIHVYIACLWRQRFQAVNRTNK